MSLKFTAEGAAFVLKHASESKDGKTRIYFDDQVTGIPGVKSLLVCYGVKASDEPEEPYVILV